MKHLLLKLILEEKLSSSGDATKIQKLQQKLDSGLSVKDLQETGLIVTKADFVKRFKNPPTLHKKCKDVMTYIGGNYIQMLSDGNYLFDYKSLKPKRSKKLEILEEALFAHLNQGE
jgi:hypothetical protein